MTSVEHLSSCRVQLVGLPPRQSATTNSFDQRVVASGGCPKCDAVSTPQRIRRNLFGAPKPGSVRELLLEETLEKHDQFKRRYNFNILSPESSNGIETSANINTNSTTVSSEDNKDNVDDGHNFAAASATQNTPLPNLITKELHDYQLKLEKTAADTAATEASNESCTASAVKLKKVDHMRKIATLKMDINAIINAETPYNRASDRQKPYARQALLTESFGQRKNVQTNAGNSRTTTLTIVAASIAKQEKIEQPEQEQQQQQPQTDVPELPTTDEDTIASTTIASSATLLDSVLEKANAPPPSLTSSSADTAKHRV